MLVLEQYNKQLLSVDKRMKRLKERETLGGLTESQVQMRLKPLQEEFNSIIKKL